MKNLFLILFCFIVSNTIAQEIQEKTINTKVSEVTVFIKNAQVTRKKLIDLKPGKTMLKFANLSPFIDAKSVQVKANGNITVLSVNHQQNYIDKLKKPAELEALEARLVTIEDNIELERTHLEILKEEITFLQTNRSIGGKNEELNATNLKDASTFYGTKLTSLKLKEIERNKNLKKLTKTRSDVSQQINTLTSKKNFSNGEILVKVDSKNSTNATFEVSYLVGNSGWFPSYDIRAKNVNEPIEIVYKANVKQDTKVDWNNVKLHLSSGNPNVSGVAPELKTYFLNYNVLPPTYNLISNEIKGKVSDGNGEPLPGVNVIVKGSTIGASTDFDGNYSITVPNSSSKLEFSYVGFESQTLAIRSSTLNVHLQEDSALLEEVVMVGYGSRNKKPRVPSKSIKIRGTSSISANSSLQLPSEQVVKQTTFDFEIDIPFSVKSDNKSYAVDMANYELPAAYNYFCVPKINKDAFLIANITNWEKYNLLEGEANIFFEDTYIGKTLLDIRSATDTLQISLGRDKNVSVKREKVKDLTTKKIIGSKKEETRVWNISVKNNKNQKINMLIFDQVPVSTLEEIKIEINNVSNGQHNVKTGEVKWNFTLEPSASKKMELGYSVKYPKNKNLIIE